MTSDGAALAAAALAALDSPAEHAALLSTVVRTARATFGATACSVAVLDQDTDELVLTALAREDEQWLLGRRFPATAGIAGWVLAAGEPMVVDDLSRSTVFAREVAESTGYVPAALMAAPIVVAEEVLGVLEVMDWSRLAITTLGAAELLTLFAGQAAAALAVARKAGTARALLSGTGDDDQTELLALIRLLLRLSPAQRTASYRLVDSVGELLLRTAP